MEDLITLKQLSNLEDVKLLDQEFKKYYAWYTPSDYHAKCLEENVKGIRITLLAYYDHVLAGCCHLIYKSKYTFFQEENIPEINDLNVFPQFRRRKIASKMFDQLEEIASRTSNLIGLGVGLFKDYGNAQRMYCRRGYVLDGKGMIYNNHQVLPGEKVVADDDLLLYLVKKLKSE